MQRPSIFTIFAIVIFATHLFSAQNQVKYNWTDLNVSQSDLLGVRASYQSNVHGNTAKQDTLRILALRVSFQIDESATTTGNGSFDLNTSSKVQIDPPPHNRMYFNDQLLALANYFARVSKGKLEIEYDVYPIGDNDSYQMPNEMKYYSGEGKEELKEQRWSELLTDAVTIADATREIEFSKYDSYFIFHAGVGNDFSFDFDPSPFDIQSVFIDSLTLYETMTKSNDHFKGIPTNDGSFFVHEGLILPETQSQEDIDIGLLGTMTILFASQLGMPSLFNTKTLKPGIGKWGLMDQGSANYQGLIPAEPCAWTKVFMGWESPIVIDGDTSVVVGSSKTKSRPHIYKIPIDSQEYFLIENRQQDANKDDRAIARDANGTRIELKQDGRIVADNQFGVITTVDDYDFGLPGSGILIWHIDERVIAKNLNSNTINNDIDHRGVDLEECDGAQDIGYDYDFLSPAYGAEAGDYWDAYWSGNESHTYVNESDEVRFSAVSIPNSNANSGAATYISIFGFGDSDTLMTFTVKKELRQNGFPVFAGTDFGRSELTVGDVDNDGSTEIFAASKTGRVYAWRSDGASFLENTEQTIFIDLKGDSTSYPSALFAVIDDSIKTSPALGDLDGDGDDEVIVVSGSGTVYVYQHQDLDRNEIADLLFQFSVGQNVLAEPMVVPLNEYGRAAIVVGTETGTLYTISWDGNGPAILWQNEDMGQAIGHLAFSNSENGEDIIVVTTLTGELFRVNPTGTTISTRVISTGRNEFIPVVYSSWNLISGKQTVLEKGYCLVSTADAFIANFVRGDVYGNDGTVSGLGPLQGYPAIADVDNDGQSDCIFVANGQLVVQRVGGAALNGFPIDLFDDTVSWLQASPTVGDIDGDGRVEILVGADSQLLAVDSNGRTVSGFPLPMGDGMHGCAVLADLDADGDVEIAALGNDGWLYVWDLNPSYNRNNITWDQHRQNAQHTANFSAAKQPKIDATELMPPKTVYCYPNPTEGNSTNIRYHLSSFAESVTVRIFDLAGDFITELVGETTVGTDNEVSWDLTSIESGVYLAQVFAQGSGHESTEIIKIAVVK